MQYLILITALGISACVTKEGTERGPIQMEKLWKAWETSGYHPDRDAGYKPARGTRKGGVIVERFYIHKDTSSDSTSGSLAGEKRCDQYFCKGKNDDTCYQFDEISSILHQDSTLLYYYLQLIQDSRPIWRLTDSVLVVKNGGSEYSLKPSRRVLVDTTGGRFLVEWPRP